MSPPQTLRYTRSTPRGTWRGGKALGVLVLSNFHRVKRNCSEVEASLHPEVWQLNEGRGSGIQCAQDMNSSGMTAAASSRESPMRITGLTRPAK